MTPSCAHDGHELDVGGNMTDRFRGQDPDNEFSSEDGHGSRDETSSMHDDPSMRHEQSAPGPEDEHEDEVGEDDLGSTW
jgi:hypothetical protein